MFSFERNAAHQQIAQRNYQDWLNHGSRCALEDNVTFLQCDLSRLAMLTEIGQVHAVRIPY